LKLTGNLLKLHIVKSEQPIFGTGKQKEKEKKTKQEKKGTRFSIASGQKL
jgi:hypothetical protein